MMRWDKTLGRIVTELSEEFEIPEEDIKYAIDHLFKNVKKCLAMPTIPKVMLHYFGTFQTSIIRLDYLKEKAKKHHAGNYITDEELDEKIKQFREVRNRLILEKPYTKLHKRAVIRDNLDGNISNE